MSIHYQIEKARYEWIAKHNGCKPSHVLIGQAIKHELLKDSHVKREPEFMPPRYQDMEMVVVSPADYPDDYIAVVG